MEMRDFTIATMPARFAELGDLHAGMDDAVWSIEPLLDWADREEVDRKLGDAPYPPNYPKQEGAPAGAAVEEGGRAPGRLGESRRRERTAWALRTGNHSNGRISVVRAVRRVARSLTWASADHRGGDKGNRCLRSAS